MSSQAEYWNDAGGISWVVGQEQLDSQLEPFGALAMDAATVRTGEVILDVGCGCGATSVELAARAGASGRVVGLDLSAPMLERARERAAGLPVEFVLGDAATHRLTPGSFNLLFSRFGVMFFDDPPSAFAHLRTALVPEGRVSMVVWQSIAANPWVSVPIAAVADVVEPPALGAVGEPGPFSLAEADHVAAILDGAGYADVNLEGRDIEMTLGGGLPLDAAVEFTVEHGPLRRVLAAATPETRAAARDRVATALSRYDGPSGVRMPAAVWIVTARSR
jgi:SAM-dependent methyltransferase